MADAIAWNCIKRSFVAKPGSLSPTTIGANKHSKCTVLEAYYLAVSGLVQHWFLVANTTSSESRTNTSYEAKTFSLF
eukprot:6155483-Amphidinium_carterae.1